MLESSGLAFVGAALFALVATPRIRALALAVDFVDRPGAHKSHHVPVPYMGGVAIIGATAIGALLASQALAPSGVLLVGAGVAMGALGLIDDDRTLMPGPRLLIQVGAAAVVVAAGVRIELTGMWLYDVVLTVVWILAITNAVNFLDNMDGLAAGIGVAAGTCIFAIAAIHGDPTVAAVSAALTGACIGYLPSNVRPAGVYMGDAGSLFLGFTLAVLALEVRPELVPPASIVVPALLLALPVVDISTVTVSRLRRRIPVSTGGRNHLSHRLVARGLSPGTAVGALVAVEAVAGVSAAAIAGGLLSVASGIVIAALLFGGLAAATMSVQVFDEQPVGFAPRLRLLAAAAVVGAVVLSLPAVVALAGARADTTAGSSSMTAALVAAQRGDHAGTRTHLARAAASFARVEHRLGHPLVSAALVVPGINVNVRAGRSLSAAAGDLAAIAARLPSATDPSDLRIADGRVPLEGLRSASATLGTLAESLRGVHAQVQDANRPLLVPAFAEPLDTLAGQLPPLVAHVERAELAARLLGPMAGEGEPRHYLVVVVVVGRSGSPGTGRVEATAAVVADSGHFRLVSFEEGADASAGRYDGVLRVDPVGLRALETLAEGGHGGAEPGGNFAHRILQGALDNDLGTPAQLAATLGEAIDGGHLRLGFTRPSEQILARRIGAVGGAS